jgi:hypothetical protein
MHWLGFNVIKSGLIASLYFNPLYLVYGFTYLTYQLLNHPLHIYSLLVSLLIGFTANMNLYSIRKTIRGLVKSPGKFNSDYDFLKRYLGNTQENANSNETDSPSTIFKMNLALIKLIGGVR